MTPEEKYKNDVSFKNLVDTIHCLITDARFTPSEVREAAVLACIHYERLNVKRPLFIPSIVNNAFNTLEKWKKKGA